MSKPKRNVVVFAAICLAACSSVSRPETKLLGKWQTTDQKTATKVSHQLYFRDQYEFFVDGSVAQMQKEKRLKDGKWEQAGTGTFKFVDPTHVKIDLGSGFFGGGITIYEIVWLDNDHITLRAGDDVMQLSRLK